MANEEAEYELRDTPEQWPIESSERLAQGQVTTYVRERVRMIDDTVANREYTLHPGAVAVLLLDDQDRILTLRQYRHPIRRIMWELPAGLLDQAGEPPLAAAQRELYEEAHLKAAEWWVLIDYYSSGGSSNEAIRVFLARGAAEADAERFVGEGEEAGIIATWVPRTDLVDAVLDGRLGNGSVTAGVLALTVALGRPGGLDSLRAADAPWNARPF
jgi:8-oxo-dGDP phosphatase